LQFRSLELAVAQPEKKNFLTLVQRTGIALFAWLSINLKVTTAQLGIYFLRAYLLHNCKL